MQVAIRPVVRPGFRSALLLTGIVAVPFLAFSAGGARADQWCGYATHQDAVVECGYLSMADCETAVGKGGMCFVDPDLALNSKRFMPRPAASAPVPTHG